MVVLYIVIGVAVILLISLLGWVFKGAGILGRLVGEGVGHFFRGLLKILIFGAVIFFIIMMCTGCFA